MNTTNMGAERIVQAVAKDPPEDVLIGNHIQPPPAT